MFLKLFLFFTLIMQLHALQIQKSYYFSDNNITTDTLFRGTTLENRLLFTINQEKKKIRIKCKDILAFFPTKDIRCKHSYVEFIKKSPINTRKLEKDLLDYYLSFYPNLKVDSISIHPQSYTSYLPSYYTLKIKNRNYKKSEGDFYIVDEDKKKIFFHYKLDASLSILKANKKVHRGEVINIHNTSLKNVKFTSFKDLPLTRDELNQYEAAHNISKNRIITQRDIKKSYLVKRHAPVILQIKNGSLIVETSATAMQNGKLNDIITIEKADKSRLKARIVSKNRVEIN